MSSGKVVEIIGAVVDVEFPRDALLKGIGGWVELEFTIEPDGSVERLPLMTKADLAAALLDRLETMLRK